MANQYQIEPQIRRIADGYHVNLTPTLRLTWSGNIKKYYEIDGNMDDRKNFVTTAKALGYLGDDRYWKIELENDAAIFVTTATEAERLYKYDEPDILNYLMTTIVGDYNFNENEENYG